MGLHVETNRTRSRGSTTTRDASRAEVGDAPSGGVTGLSRRGEEEAVARRSRRGWVVDFNEEVWPSFGLFCCDGPGTVLLKFRAVIRWRGRSGASGTPRPFSINYPVALLSGFKRSPARLDTDRARESVRPCLSESSHDGCRGFTRNS